MTEPDVTLTDYVLALESLLFVVVLHRSKARNRALRLWFTVFFASVSAASLFGGTVHGFFLDEHSLGQAILWPATLLAIGLVALSFWVIGARLLFSRRVTNWVTVAAVAQFVLYGVAVVSLTSEFWFAILGYLPAALFLLSSLLVTYRREKHMSVLLAVSGVVLTIVGAFLQQLEVGIHPAYFNHNAVYHMLQAVALFLIFRGACWIVSAELSSKREAPVDIEQCASSAPSDDLMEHAREP